jgi:argininosuccinate lyase
MVCGASLDYARDDTLTLQWGGRFGAAPDAALLAFGSSLEDDLVLAPFDVHTSQAHVDALAGGKIIDAVTAGALQNALKTVANEIVAGTFAAYARDTNAEDVHGAIDARVRELEPEAGALLHAGRSRNDQVATTLALYAHDRALHGAQRVKSIARHLVARASEELSEGTLLAATTHMQPAQPVLLAFWLQAAAEPFVRGAHRFAAAAEAAMHVCPLGSGAVSGSTLPLDRDAACKRLGFAHPSRNAMDAIGTRDAVLDVAQACVRALADASRVSAEIVIWATPAFGYVRLGDASSTGSSLMPQKRNPDIFELVRGYASEAAGLFFGALTSTIGMPLSYHRDLQETKRLAIATCERALAALDVFERALRDTTFERSAMQARAGAGYTVATDLADALIAAGVTARDAHALVGAVVRAAEESGRALDAHDLGALAMDAGLKELKAPLTPAESVAAKKTSGSTSPDAVRAGLALLAAELDSL